MKSFKVKCLHACIGQIYLLYISSLKRFNLLVMRTSQWKKIDNFQRNAQGAHLVFYCCYFMPKVYIVAFSKEP